MKYKLCLLDIDYVIEGGKAVIRIFGRTEGGKSAVLIDRNVEPWFLVLSDKIGNAEKSLENLKGEGFSIQRVEKETREYLGEKVEFLKAFTKLPGEIRTAREKVRTLTGVKGVFEADILFTHRYILDNSLRPMGMLEVEAEEVEKPEKFELDLVLEARGSPKYTEGDIPKLNIMSFDIEASNPRGMPNADKDPIIMMSVASDSEEKVISQKKTDGSQKYVEDVKDEAGILKRFEEIVREQDVDILAAYNSDNFDFPYIRDRAEKLKHELNIGRAGGAVRFKSRGRYSAAESRGRIHADLFHYVTIILRGALGQINSRSLKSVAEKFLPEDSRKKDLDWRKMNEYWEKGGKELRELFDYSMVDATVTKKLADLFMPREYELSRLVRVPLFDAMRTTYGRLVENYLMWNAIERGLVIPNRPEQEEMGERAATGAIEGAYVKEPEKGMHENVAVMDFKSLYPSIIISHNIDASTVNCDCCKEKAEKVEDLGTWMCTKSEGLMPIVLKNILKERTELKKKMKELEKNSKEYQTLDNRQYSLKILANSAYGYLAFRGSRWYTRKGGSTTTALGRMYTHKIIDTAEDFGLRSIYGDTDSLFVVSEEGDIEKKVKKFLKKINSELPGVMELEFEGVYKRGIFVSKKRYAMIDEKGDTLIKGLEFVRRDWSPIAKKTQKEVIESILEDGNSEKAFEIVRDTIRKIKNREISKEDVVVYTQLTRPLDKYKVTAPHIKVAKDMKNRGEEVVTGTSIGYIITEGGGSISERAKQVDEVDVKKIDRKYYVENQIIPAVSRVMEALGYGKEDLLGKKQSTLEGF
ncbi:TPA: ribonuclease H-like domain-containing protein [archaeon]|nr:ribonuclease H-like domain-containing protein [Candidatus Undinarchaeales archaeon SRR5007147.bin71]